MQGRVGERLKYTQHQEREAVKPASTVQVKRTTGGVTVCVETKCTVRMNITPKVFFAGEWSGQVSTKRRPTGDTQTPEGP